MLIEWAFPGLFYAVWLYFGAIYLMNTRFGAGIMIPVSNISVNFLFVNYLSHAATAKFMGYLFKT